MMNQAESMIITLFTFDPETELKMECINVQLSFSRISLSESAQLQKSEHSSDYYLSLTQGSDKFIEKFEPSAVWSKYLF